jgi:hypothetical protein
MILTVPDAELLDGLLQHPDTSPYFGGRLGPTVAIVSEDSWEPLQATLKTLGLRFVDNDALPDDSVTDKGAAKSKKSSR